MSYKDGLATTGRSTVVRKFPTIPSIDLAGTVETSAHPNFKLGDKVLLNGIGLGLPRHGGYVELARVKGDRLVPLRKAFAAAQATPIGTAGYTAMLCVLALEDAGVPPGRGPAVVTALLAASECDCRLRAGPRARSAQLRRALHPQRHLASWS